jgi:nucleotide-binding universal stress UspA family protein
MEQLHNGIRTEYGRLHKEKEMNVLIAIDSSASAHAALAAALARTWNEGTQFRVLTVLPEPGKSKGSRKQHPQREKAHRLIDRATSLIEAANPDSIVVGQIDVGDPAQSILSAARSWPAELIIVGSHDRGPLERLLIGSVSRKIIDSAQCSVLVARNFDCFLNRILVAIDQTVSAQQALRTVLQSPWTDRTRFHFVTVVEATAIFDLQPSAVMAAAQLELHDQQVAAARAALERAVADVNEIFGRQCASYSIVQGDPRQTIVAVAKDWQADLIVVGSRGLSGLRDRIFGSCAKAVAVAADCSVQIVRSNLVELARPEPERLHRFLRKTSSF